MTSNLFYLRRVVGVYDLENDVNIWNLISNVENNLEYH